MTCDLVVVVVVVVVDQQLVHKLEPTFGDYALVHKANVASPTPPSPPPIKAHARTTQGLQSPLGSNSL